MGFAESLGKWMTKLLGSHATSWEQHLTAEQIDEMEKQGADVTEIRKRFEERQVAIQAHRDELVQKSLAALDMEKLQPYLTIPRDIESPFVKELVSMNSLSSKARKAMADAPIVYGTVVQAHSALWEPGNEGRYGVVFCFALDNKHMHDAEWLRDLADKISEMKKSNSVPADNEKFIKTLRDDQSMFCFKLGESLCGDADAWCATFTVTKRSNLPLGYLPATKMLPLALTEYPKVNQFAELQYIPLKYYTK